MAGPVVVVLPDLEALSLRAAELFVEKAQQAIGGQGRFRAALSGGSTPRRLYELLGSPRYIARVNWDETDLFWGDERIVPPTDPRSNFHMAGKALLHKIPAVTYRIKGEKDAGSAASEYEAQLRRAFGLRGLDELPRFDLVLLGMGEDGHAASLFPGSPALSECRRLAVPVTDREPARVTLSLPVLNNAASVVFMVTGEGKAEAVRDILEQNNSHGYPAGLVNPPQGELTWLLDSAAASMLEHAASEAG